jgi:hypothetical protein
LCIVRPLLGFQRAATLEACQLTGMQVRCQQMWRVLGFGD